jgi:hypothetical protein
MNRNDAVLAHDLMIMEEMAANMGAYLDSDIVDWTIPRANMPRLTIGGYLMRQRRLSLLKERLDDEDRDRLRLAIALFEQTLDERVVRFEKRSHQELHMRIAEWMGFLRDMNRRAKTEVNYYAGVVDTRIVMHELIGIMETFPYELKEGIMQEVDAMDRILRIRLLDHPFIWDPVWEEAYPRDEFWWLYGCPRLV